MQADNIFTGFDPAYNIMGSFDHDASAHGGGGAALAGAAAMGFAPFPFNPFFIPIQMTMFIILIIILLYWGASFWTAAFLAYLIPAVLATAFHYTVTMNTIGRFVPI